MTDLDTGNETTHIASRAELAAIFKELKIGALAAQRLAGKANERGDCADDAFFCGAEWALLEAQQVIMEKMGWRTPRSDDWVEAL